MAARALVVHTKANGTWSAPHARGLSLGFGENDVERDSIYDYDFDVVEYTDGRGNQDAYVLLVSGERPPATILFSIRQAQPVCCPLCACA